MWLEFIPSLLNNSLFLLFIALLNLLKRIKLWLYEHKEKVFQAIRFNSSSLELYKQLKSLLTKEISQAISLVNPYL